jgi:hypothetical protein
MASNSDERIYESTKELESGFNVKSKDELARDAVEIATKQIMACTEFKKPRLQRISKYYALYDGKVPRKLRQLFNVPIPVFAGMIDTLNAQYDTPIQLKFKEGDPSDYFKVQKLNGAWQMEVMNTTQNSKWDSKLRIGRFHGIMTGRAILEYTAASEPEYYTELNTVSLKNFNFQPRGGLYLENHLFAGTEDIEKTSGELEEGAKNGLYDKEQVRKLLMNCADGQYLPLGSHEYGIRLERFKPLGLDPDNHSYVGQAVYKLAHQIIELKGQRYYVLFHPWSQTWLRFERWSEISKSDLFPWVTYATHEDDENFLSKSYADDLYPAADAIVAMFNQELTNREKRNFGARAYDKDMFTDVRKLDEAMHRPDALVPADTKGGTRRISEGIFEFKVGELQGTVNLIDWISGTLGRNTGATELSQGSVAEVSKKASVTFAEQKSVSKRIGWASQPFQNMMADLGNLYLWGLRDHMPSKMAIRMLGVGGWDWDEISRLDLDTRKNVDVLIVSTDQEIQDSELKKKSRAEALAMLDPNFINPQKKNEEILYSIGDYSDEEVAEFMDMKTYQDRKAIAKAHEAIQMIMRGQQPEMWFGANIAFIQKILDVANDKRSTLKDKFETMVEYAMAHEDIARENIERQVLEEERAATMMQPPQPGAPANPPAENPGVPGGMSRAMSMAEAVV